MTDYDLDVDQFVKVNLFENGKELTEKQKQRGSLKGKIQHYSAKLKCYFYLPPDVDIAEIEQKYLERPMF